MCGSRQRRHGCCTAAGGGRSQDHSPLAPSFLVPPPQPPEHGSPQATSKNLQGVKRLALLDFSELRANKKPWTPVSSPGLQEWHWSCPQTLGTQQPGTWGQQQGGLLPPSSRAGELESRRTRRHAVTGERVPHARSSTTLLLKALEATIVHEHSHFKKTYPSYHQEKNRCEYVHQKLSHIKSLILQFEGSGSS
ncbi:RNA polymerase II elongation factor ELL3 isoform X1 [Falco peregrinus]|uniref:RNA polymerase II elongation factor ELL3 isoform X1 n=1 Tax=Falco peregrinus TaxID=8954 RepID=UPI0024788E60|nr:RNA polymerase II elongation factor ELL3 isoform X1 [Falco peregrinus]